MTTSLAVENLVKRYGDVRAVRGVSFDVTQGEIFGLLGPNGAGKTTTLECIFGLRRPDEGSVRIAGIDALARPAAAREIIGVQLQSTALQDKITPRQALRFFGSFYSKSIGVESLIEQFHLADKADSPFDTLSTGQRQRLSIALALVNDPQIVFLDEPTASLDPQSRRELHRAIAGLKSAGRTIVLTTHYIDEAHGLCDCIGIMDRGLIVALGKPDELIASSKATTRIVVTTARPMTQAQSSGLEGVTKAQPHEGRFSLTTQSVTRTLLGLVHLVEAEGNELLDLQIHRPTLEDVFLELTGTRLDS